MKPKFLFLFLIFLIISCSKPSNSDEFIENVTGRYLYTSDQVVEVHFKDKIMLLTMEGLKDAEPMKLDDNMFFVKEINEKISFKTNPTNQKKYLVLMPKADNSELEFKFKKMNEGELIPKEYLLNNNFNKALAGYLAIKEKDSTDIAINEREMNSLGYDHLRKKNFKQALNIFKINAALHPYSYNVYDSLGEAYRKSGDTMQAVVNYKKALIYDSGNERLKRTIEELEN